MAESSSLPNTQIKEESDQEEKIIFKPKKRKNLRPIRKDADDEVEVEEDSAETLAKIEEMRELQKLRQRPNGINIIGLALGKKVTVEEEITVKDPFKIQSGGMVNMQALKTGKLKKSDDAYDTGIGTQFSVETNKRDEDEEMQKYIEEELQRRKGVKKSDDEDDSGTNSKYLTPEETALMSLPEHLRKNNIQKSEEMLSNQMLNGIPEIDLGIEAKIKNIEATEEAKQRMIEEQKKKKDTPSHFVPINIATNFIQHEKVNHNKLAAQKRKAAEGQQQAQQNQPRDNKRATDDYYFDKFRNKFRKN